MRIAIVLLPFLLASAALAQVCQPDQIDEGEVCPDTTDWRSYFPLEVGNRWQYVYDPFLEGENTYRGVEIVASEEIEGVEYFRLRHCDRTGIGSTCARELWVRYDEERRSVRERREVDGEVLYFDYLGDLGASFEPPLVYGEYAFSYGLESGPTVMGTRKGFFTAGGSVDYLSGIGPFYFTIEASPDEERLIHARIGGVSYGTPRFEFPTAGEPDVAQPVSTSFTELFPNPARGAVQAQYTLGVPQAVTLELIDLLGRRVRSTEMGRQGADTHDVGIDTGGLRPGLYLLRLRGDAGAEATRRIVVLR